MTVGASKVVWVTAFPAGKIVGPERVGQQLAQRPRAQRVVDQHLGTAVLQQHLAAPPTRHQQLAVGVDAGQCDQPAATAGMQGADHRALGAET